MVLEVARFAVGELRRQTEDRLEEVAQDLVSSFQLLGGTVYRPAVFAGDA